MGTALIEELRSLARTFVGSAGRSSAHHGWWRTPLLVSATVDKRFDCLTRIAAENHFHPRELLPAARSVIVFFVPFRKDLVKENRKGDRPSRNWGVAYVQTNELIDRLGRAIDSRLAQRGFMSGLTPATHNFDAERLMARWSHKHLGYLSGLGRFGAHNLLITPAGCAGRLGSLVTDAPLGNHPLMDTDEACLLKAGKECNKCITVCPVDALREDGFERRSCWNRLVENRDRLPYFADLPQSTHVCGKCAAMMPCSFQNPVKPLSPLSRTTSP